MYSWTMPSMDPFSTGPRYSRKNTATMPSSVTVMASIVTTSFVNTDPRMCPRSAALSLIAVSRKPVADPPHRPDESRLLRIVPEFLAQATDEDVDRAVVGVEVDAVCFVQNAVAAKDAAAIAHEHAEQFEFGRRERQATPIHADQGGGPIEVERTDADWVLASARAPAQHRLHAGHQLARFEWLRHVVIRSEFEPYDPIVDRSACREHDDRHATALAHLAAHGESIDFRQHHVEDDDIGRLAFERLKALPRVERNGDLEVEPAQKPGQECIQLLVVVDQEHACARRIQCRHSVVSPSLTRMLSMVQRAQTAASQVQDHEQENECDDEDCESLYPARGPFAIHRDACGARVLFAPFPQAVGCQSLRLVDGECDVDQKREQCSTRVANELDLQRVQIATGDNARTSSGGYTTDRLRMQKQQHGRQNRQHEFHEHPVVPEQPPRCSQCDDEPRQERHEGQRDDDDPRRELRREIDGSDGELVPAYQTCNREGEKTADRSEPSH